MTDSAPQPDPESVVRRRTLRRQMLEEARHTMTERELAIIARTKELAGQAP